MPNRCKPLRRIDPGQLLDEVEKAMQREHAKVQDKRLDGFEAAIHAGALVALMEVALAIRGSIVKESADAGEI